MTKIVNKLSTSDGFVLNNGYNSSNEYIAKWLWYVKNLLPSWFGGFKKTI